MSDALFQDATAEELRTFSETKQLFKTSVLRLQFDELLKAAQVGTDGMAELSSKVDDIAQVVSNFENAGDNNLILSLE